MSSVPAAAVATKDLALCFGRLAEKTLFMNGSAGACCHSGCDNCPFRYDFDVMQSGRPKWIPAYAEREFDDGRKHTAKWLSLFQSGELLVTLTKAQFKERAAALAFAMPLGPSGFFQPSEAPSDDALEALWAALAGSAAADVLSAEDIEARLRALSEDGHSVQWGGFERTVAAAAAAL